MDHPLPWLRYVGADDMSDDGVDFDGMEVEGSDSQRLGDVEGFIVDSDTGRPFYVVVEAGGWFRSKHFLLPVGHTRLDALREVLVSDLPKDRVKNFPGFDIDEFGKLTEKDVQRLNNETCQACSIEGVGVVYSMSEPIAAAWDRPDYRYPDWWKSEPSRPDRMGSRAVTAGAEFPPAASRTGDRAGSARDENVVARESDSSPHFDGRAQPGDVLGVETGGEQTHVGDTAEDENKRRHDAEEANRKRRD